MIKARRTFGDVLAEISAVPEVIDGTERFSPAPSATTVCIGHVAGEQIQYTPEDGQMGAVAPVIDADTVADIAKHAPDF